MPVERMKELRRRRHRRAKLKKLRKKLLEAQTPEERAKIIEKIRKISPWYPIPEIKESPGSGA